MYCRQCGAQNHDSSVNCSSCGQTLYKPIPGNEIRIPNYLVQAILVTLFCCLPFGIVAIVFAAQVNGKIAAGDIDGALVSSRRAKIWSWVSFGVGLAIFLVSFLVPFFAEMNLAQ